MNQKGFSQAVVILAVLGIVIIGTAGYFVFNKKSPVEPPAPIPLANNIESGTLGILQVLTGRCGIPEGCGPKYRLYDSEFKSFIPLLGNIKEKDSELIVRVVGDKTTLPPSEYGDMLYRGTTEAIRVLSYSVLSKIPYHKFLINKGDEYTLQKYPCLVSKVYGLISVITHNKTFSWEFLNNIPIIKVRINTLTGVEPEAFYELWYDGNSGNFIKEVAEPESKVFCP